MGVLTMELEKNRKDITKEINDINATLENQLNKQNKEKKQLDEMDLKPKEKQILRRSLFEIMYEAFYNMHIDDDPNVIDFYINEWLDVCNAFRHVENREKIINKTLEFETTNLTLKRDYLNEIYFKTLKKVEDKINLATTDKVQKMSAERRKQFNDIRIKKLARTMVEDFNEINKTVYGKHWKWKVRAHDKQNEEKQIKKTGFLYLINKILGG